ncbi:17261_t:CDS:2 [Acaulospora morrowiae]|uniref:17261_t:CDS:1 n=1 Tax=Acaulospora morrowiae TaxID=94023 RepID=A0A9N8YV63_9GLOM|nr:17261_t:CDS:2 [Acaulospora morrowiae]
MSYSQLNDSQITKNPLIPSINEIQSSSSNRLGKITKDTHVLHEENTDNSGVIGRNVNPRCKKHCQHEYQKRMKELSKNRAIYLKKRKAQYKSRRRAEKRRLLRNPQPIPYALRLPVETFTRVCSYLPPSDLYSLTRVCKQWRSWLDAPENKYTQEIWAHSQSGKRFQAGSLIASSVQMPKLTNIVATRIPWSDVAGIVTVSTQDVRGRNLELPKQTIAVASDISTVTDICALTNRLMNLNYYSSFEKEIDALTTSY